MKKNYLYLLVSGFVCFLSCEKAAFKEEYGTALLYMPQAIVQSEGNNNNFHIDISESATADTLIPVGIYRSGTAPLTTVTVDLVSAQDSLEKAIQLAQLPDADDVFSLYKNAELMPSEYFEVVNQITLYDGERETYVPLTVNKGKLLADADFGSKTYVLPLRIMNPSKYELNEKLSLVMFVFSRK